MQEKYRIFFTLFSLGDKADELRSQLEKLEAEYDELSKVAQKEIQEAKNNLKKAEMETLQGKVGLMEGKMALQKHWKQLESLQTKHKKKQEEVQCRIREIRGKLEKAEVVEEEELMNIWIAEAISYKIIRSFVKECEKCSLRYVRIWKRKFVSRNKTPDDVNRMKSNENRNRINIKQSNAI